jgi:hypothetical protein
MVWMANESGLRWRTICSVLFPNLYHACNALKTGKGVLELDFFNACYTEGVQDFSGVRIKILLRAENYLFGHLLGYEAEVRSALISHIEFTWLECFCHEIIKAHPPPEMGPPYSGSVSFYLDQIFGIHG